MNRIEPVFPEETELNITEELLSIHALNPFSPNNSSSRSIMFSSHLSQALVVENGEEKIIQSGIEKQLGANTFNKKLENDSRILNVIKRYDGIDSNSVNSTSELLVIYEDLMTGEIDYLDIPPYFSLHQYFGFRYKWNDKILNNIYKNQILPADTILADSPSVSENSGYKYGINANIALLSIPEVAEDGMVVSRSMAKKLTYRTFEKRIIEFGSTKFPLNIYGDEKNYKPFPDIGEKINDDSVVMVLRNYNPELSPALTSVKDVMRFSPVFDECIYAKNPGGIILDIKILNAPRFKKELYNGTAGTAMKYVNGFQKFNRDIIQVYEELEREHYRKFKNNNIQVSERFNKLVMDAYAIVNPDNYNIGYSYKNEQVDMYRCEITIMYEHSITNENGGLVTKGLKITDSSG